MTRKLLIDLPGGDQQVITVGEGGGYYDDSAVLWDEGIDGTMPEITIGAMVREDEELVYSSDRLDLYQQAASAVPVPVSITPRQGLLILSRYNLLETVQSMLAAMTGQEGVEARIDFEKANEWKRDWPLLNDMATALGLSQAQVDQMFIEASVL